VVHEGEGVLPSLLVQDRREHLFGRRKKERISLQPC
jgi:hypothetical protein